MVCDRLIWILISVNLKFSADLINDDELSSANWNVGKLEYPFGRGLNLQIDVTDVSAMSKRLADNGIVPYKDVFESCYSIKGREYHCKELLVQDPDGYLLRFAQEG